VQGFSEAASTVSLVLEPGGSPQHLHQGAEQFELPLFAPAGFRT